MTLLEHDARWLFMSLLTLAIVLLTNELTIIIIIIIKDICIAQDR